MRSNENAVVCYIGFSSVRSRDCYLVGSYPFLLKANPYRERVGDWASVISISGCPSVFYRKNSRHPIITLKVATTQLPWDFGRSFCRTSDHLTPSYHLLTTRPAFNKIEYVFWILLGCWPTIDRALDCMAYLWVQRLNSRQVRSFQRSCGEFRYPWSSCPIKLEN